MSDVELTIEAKEALRKYVITLLIVPSAVLTTVGFALGYAINDWAKGQAYVKAFEGTSSKMFDMAISAGAAADDAEDAQEKIKKVMLAAEKSKLEIEEFRQLSSDALQTINSIDVFKTAGDQINQIAEAVLVKGNIEGKVSSRFDSRLTNIENYTKKIRQSNTGQLIEIKGGAPWGNWHPATYCPDNFYVCGLQQKVEPKQGNNDDTGLNSIKMACCPL